jgi:UDPglucose--hexose-1-phosphate uridylyltransferase
MASNRIDPLSGEKVIVAGERAARPGGGPAAEPAPALDPATDPFAEGAEARTPPELYAVRPGGGPVDGPGWTVRVVPNLFPVLAPDATGPAPDAQPDLFGGRAAIGGHEVIVNAPQSVGALAALEPEQVTAALDAWRERMRAHHQAAYVHVMVNERREAGSSLPHTHAQLYALDFVPSPVAREREAFAAHAVRTMGRNLLEDVVQEEVRRRERIVAIDDEAVLLAPWASRMAYQLMLVPRRPRMRFEDDGPTGGALLHDALGRLARRLGANPPLNLWVRTAPRGAEHFCWRIDVLPRVTHLAGLELGAGVYVNVVAPEQAAAELRDA